MRQEKRHANGERDRDGGRGRDREMRRLIGLKAANE